MESICGLKLIVASILLSCALGAPSEDLITSLPGLDYAINFNQYSGYLNGSTGDHLFYWFVESQGDPATDPLVLWFNGGPGCSSLLGMLQELGPFAINAAGTGVDDNPYAWNKVANMVFLEAPACVGFSYSELNTDCTTSDDETALSNYEAVKSFFRKFPEYSGRDFYITGESYAGIYVPTLAVLVVNGNGDFPINFKGYAIGNGIYSTRTNEDSLMFYGYHHGILGQALWDELVANCCEEGIGDQEHCDFTYNTDTRCIADVTRATQLIFYGGMNAYDLYGMCYHSVDGEAHHENRLSTHYRNVLQRNPERESRAPGDVFCSFPRDEDCRTWLNDDATKTALHVSPQSPVWDACSNLNYTRMYSDVYPELSYLQQSGIRGLIYNGDCDTVCNVISNTWDVQTVVDQLNLTVVEGHARWTETEQQQVGGFVKTYDFLDFVTVRGAGHMVPETRPSQSLQMFTNYLLNQPYGPN